MSHIIMCIVGYFIGMGVGEYYATKYERRKAIEANVAEYRIDSKTGVGTFVFLTPRP